MLAQRINTKVSIVTHAILFFIVYYYGTDGNWTAQTALSSKILFYSFLVITSLRLYNSFVDDSKDKRLRALGVASVMLTALWWGLYFYIDTLYFYNNNILILNLIILLGLNSGASVSLSSKLKIAFPYFALLNIPTNIVLFGVPEIGGYLGFLHIFFTAFHLVYAVKINGSLKFQEKGIIKLENSNKFNEAIFENAPDTILLFEDTKIVNCNTKALEMFGFESKDEIRGKTIVNLSPEKQDNGSVSWKAAQERTINVKNDTDVAFEWNLLNNEGDLFDAKISLKYIVFADKGIVQAIIRDISEEKDQIKNILELNAKSFEAEMRIKEQNQVLEDKNEYLETQKGIIDNINTSLEEKQEEIRQQNEELYVQNENLVEQRDIIETARQELFDSQEEIQQQNEELEAQNEYLREQRFKLEEIKEEINSQNETLLLQNDEITKARTKAEEASYYKSMFVASMSHEIRTPLNGILGVSKMLNKELTNDKQLDLLKIIDISGKNLLGVINDIIDFSKIEANQLSIENIPFDLRECLEEIKLMLNYKSTEKAISMSFKIDRDIPEIIIGDPTRLKQILINYINNAIKFTSKYGEITVRAQLINSIDGNCEIKYSVSDTGIGIPQSKQKLLFNDYVQVDSSTSRKYGGSGLGLSISKKLALLMKGKVGLESVENIGSTFWFSGNFEKYEEVKSELVDEVEVVNAERTFKILIVEDNPVNQLVAEHMLGEISSDITVVENGQLGFEETIENKYDIVFMDIQMPVLNGYDATKKIRHYEESHDISRTIIIAMTANAMNNEKQKCVDIGMDDYISKPFEMKDIHRVIESVLSVNA